jgi:hypothetical protein
MFGEWLDERGTTVTEGLRYVIHADLPKSFEGGSFYLSSRH